MSISKEQETNMALARLGFDICNVTRELNRAGEAYAPDVANYDNGVYSFSGLATMIEWAALFARSIPNMDAKITAQMAGDGFVVSHYHSTGLIVGELCGVAPHGATLDLRGTYIDVIRNGKIAEHWGYYDSASFLQQVGAIVIPGSAGHLPEAH
jgi:predicted ester cyclase